MSDGGPDSVQSPQPVALAGRCMLGYRAPPAKTRLGARHDVVAEATPVCWRPFGSPSGWVTARLDAGPPAWFRAVDTIQGEGGRHSVRSYAVRIGVFKITDGF